MEENARINLNVINVKNIIVTVRKAGVEKNVRFPHYLVSIVWAIRMKEFIRTSV